VFSEDTSNLVRLSGANSARDSANSSFLYGLGLHKSGVLQEYVTLAKCFPTTVPQNILGESSNNTNFEKPQKISNIPRSI
jgi:hypothetical protein